MANGNRSGRPRKDDTTEGNDDVTARNGDVPPGVRRPGRRSFMKAVGAIATAPLAATAARASERPADESEPQDGNGEGNPTHRGGGDGYPRRVAPSAASVVVSNYDEFAAALENASAGDVVYVDGDAVIDVGSNELTIPAGVTLASDRGIDGSLGGLVKTPVLDQWPGVLTAEDDVRVTGLRLGGPANEYQEYQKPVASGLIVEGADCEVDNVEAWGFNHAAIRLERSAHVHHSFVHNNPMDGLGYGVLCKGGDESIIEHNNFNYNRHSVANDGSAGYVVRFNYFGSKAVSYQVGTHRPGGTTLEIHHNTFEATRHVATDGEVEPHVVIRGTPDDVADVHHNWFHNSLEPRDRPNMWTDEAITQVFTDQWNNVEFSDNAYGPAEPPEDVGCPR